MLSQLINLCKRINCDSIHERRDANSKYKSIKMSSLLATREEHRFCNYFDVKIDFISSNMREREYIDR